MWGKEARQGLLIVIKSHAGASRQGAMCTGEAERAHMARKDAASLQFRGTPCPGCATGCHRLQPSTMRLAPRHEAAQHTPASATPPAGGCSAARVGALGAGAGGAGAGAAGGGAKGREGAAGAGAGACLGAAGPLAGRAAAGGGAASAAGTAGAAAGAAAAAAQREGWAGWGTGACNKRAGGAAALNSRCGQTSARSPGPACWTSINPNHNSTQEAELPSWHTPPC